MRPGAFSKGGFLGANESLLAVLEQDLRTLEEAHLPAEQIADGLERVLGSAMKQRDELLAAREAAYGRPTGTLKTALQLAMQTAPQEDEFARRNVDLPDLLANSPPTFSCNNLPEPEAGYTVEESLQVFFATYRGLQACPWGCPLHPWANFDFLILNRQSGECITGPGLIVHLIRAHQFFEGYESPYRVDPARAIQVLGLVPGNSIDY